MTREVSAIFEIKWLLKVDSVCGIQRLRYFDNSICQYLLVVECTPVILNNMMIETPLLKEGTCESENLLLLLLPQTKCSGKLCVYM